MPWLGIEPATLWFSVQHLIHWPTPDRAKERILKAARQKWLVTYKGIPIKLAADFLTETLQARREWQEIFKAMNSKDIHTKFFYPEKLSFRIEGQIKCFPDKKKLKEFITTKPELPFFLKITLFLIMRRIPSIHSFSCMVKKLTF